MTSAASPLPGWVFFDVDQTLCDFATMMRRALSDILVIIEERWPELAGRYTPDDLERIRDEIADSYGPRPVPLVAVRRQMFVRVLADVADDREIDEITDHYLAVRFADPILFDDVVPALDGLHGRVRLGVITNGNSKIDSLGLEHYFEAEFVAEQVGYAKPDIRIYQHAADAVGADPSELIMVGDSYEEDFRAARSAGWQARWLRRDAAPEPPHVISDLRQLH